MDQWKIVMNISQAIDQLRQGKIIAYPTETVWGLGVLADKEDPIEKLIKLKGRELAKGISLLVRDLSMLDEWAEMGKEKEKNFLEVVWPGPVTVVLPAKNKVSPLLHGGTQEIGLRISSHPLVQKLMDELDVPLTTTSANISGFPPARNRSELFWLPHEVGVLDEDENKGVISETGESLPSTVLSLKNQKIKLLREGSISFEEIKLLAKTFSFSISLESSCQ